MNSKTPGDEIAQCISNAFGFIKRLHDDHKNKSTSDVRNLIERILFRSLASGELFEPNKLAETAQWEWSDIVRHPAETVTMRQIEENLAVQLPTGDTVIIDYSVGVSVYLNGDELVDDKKRRRAKPVAVQER